MGVRIGTRSNKTLDYPLKNMILLAVLLLTGHWLCESYRMLTDAEHPEPDVQWYTVLLRLVHLLIVFETNRQGCFQCYLIVIASLLFLFGMEFDDDWLEKFEDEEVAGKTSMLFGRLFILSWWVVIAYSFLQIYKLRDQKTPEEESDDMCMA